MSDQRLLTVAQVAERLQLSEVSIRRKIAAGQLPAIRLAERGRGAIRIPERELERWLNADPDPPEAA